jgi:hypothetical protein
MASAITHIQASICGAYQPPTITTPSSGTTTNDPTAIISGNGEPAMSTTIVEGTTDLGTTLVAPDTTYALEVPLTAGDNAIFAREVDGCGTIKDSATILIHYQVVSQGTQASGPLGSIAQDKGQLPVSLPSPPTVSSVEQPTTGQAYAGGVYTTAPTITLPVSGSTFNNSHIWVRGKAQPGSIVTVYLDGNNVAAVEASASGDYGVLVSLQPGRNTIQVSAEKEGAAMTSPALYVNLIGPPLVAQPRLFDTTIVRITLITSAFAMLVASAWYEHGVRERIREKQ